MELPFKYLMLCMIKKLNDRKMKLTIDKETTMEFITEYMKKSFYTPNEKKEMGSNFIFEYEWDNFTSYYYQYIDVDGNEITFDIDYIDELDILINNQKDELGEFHFNDINFVIDNSISFLEILNVNIRENLYEFLSGLEKELENNYDELCEIDTYIGIKEVDTKEIIKKIKYIHMQKIIMLMNSKSLLPKIEQEDLALYAVEAVDIVDELDDISLLTEDIDFGESDIMQDTFYLSIFSGKDVYDSNLRDSIVNNCNGVAIDEKNNRIKFYMTFLELLEREINNSNEFLNIELIRIKYRVMNYLDSVYCTSLFINKNIDLNDEFEENYYFASAAVYYFIDELLHYEDDKYMNTVTDMDNIMIYLNNIIKKILIETYYKLTNEKLVVDKIRKNKLYGVNTISSGFLKDIIDRPKTKIKEI